MVVIIITVAEGKITSRMRSFDLMIPSYFFMCVSHVSVWPISTTNFMLLLLYSLHFSFNFFVYKISSNCINYPKKNSVYKNIIKLYKNT